MTDKNLWQSKHPYHGTSGCYYAPATECHQTYQSWGAFAEEWGDADLDYNLLYRWDWLEGKSNENEDGELAHRARLELYFIQQRRAVPFSVYVYVTREDEPQVREYLTARYEHLLKLWTPLSRGDQ